MGFFDTIFGKKNNLKGEEQEKKREWEWTALTSEKQLDDIERESAVHPVVIFKHSTRCGISRMAYRNFENDLVVAEEKLKCYYLDLLAYRVISDAIISRFGIPHESPQALLIKSGKVIYHASHGEISAAEVQGLVDDK